MKRKIYLKRKINYKLVKLIYPLLVILNKDVKQLKRKNTQTN